MRSAIRFLVASAFATLAQASAGGADAAHAQTVRTVLFFSPTCPHCHQVIRDDLPVFFGMYGGQPQTYTDESIPEDQRFVHLFSNGQLDVLLVNASTRAGSALYEASFALSDGVPSGVPRMIVDTTVMVGAVEIPNRLHGLIQNGLASGGVDWPEIQGLAEAISGIPQAAPLTTLADAEDPSPDTVVALEPEPEPAATPAESPTEQAEEVPAQPTAAPDTTVRPEAPVTPPDPPEEETADSVVVTTDSTANEGVAPQESDSVAATIAALQDVTGRRPSMMENFSRDPVGNGMSVLVLVGMIASLLLVTRYAQGAQPNQTLGLAIPVLSVIGIGVAAYLSYIEVGEVTAVCGPVGDCNTVNQSEYATLFGVLPVGVLGLMGYVTIIAAWIVARTAARPLADWATIALFGGAAFGTLFSVYLTFLEPFVIGATCIWCLSSAVIITLIMWLSARPTWEAWQRAT